MSGPRRRVSIDYAIENITAFGVMRTPTLAIDGQVKIPGRLPALDELKEMLQSS